ncbi:MAG: DUF3303 domain-containing protein [Saprospiraceae bacterium]|nr:DUF3303 domain-containing protein [Saprospiraceae bacterium]
MKFMLSWRVHDEQRHNALHAFSQMTAADDAADMGSAVKLIGRWHNIAEFTGVAIYECDDPIAMANWALNWNGILDCEISPVLDDEETRALGRQRADAAAQAN